MFSLKKIVEINSKPVPQPHNSLSEQELSFLKDKCALSDKEIKDFAAHADKIRGQEVWHSYDLVEALRRYPGYIAYEKENYK